MEILRDPGDNVGHWNLPERRIEIRGDDVLADGAPCRLVRFSGYDPERPERATLHTTRLQTSALGDAGRLFDRYRRLLLEAGQRETSRWPYAWDAFDDGAPIPSVARELFADLGEAGDRFGDPFATAGPGSFRAWLDAPAARIELGGRSRRFALLARSLGAPRGSPADLRRPARRRSRGLSLLGVDLGIREHPGSDRFLDGFEP